MGDPRKGLDQFQVTQRNITSTGPIGISQYTIKAESTLRIAVVDAGPTNVVTVEARIGTADWNVLGTITGETEEIFDLASYDFARFSTTTYGGTPFDFVASGFFPTPGNATAANQATIIDLLDDIANGGEGIIVFGTASSVAASTDTTVVSYTVPASKVFRLKQAAGTGDACSKWRLKRDSVEEDRRRSAWTDRNAIFSYNSLKYLAGEVITLSVEHDESTSKDFQASLHGSVDDV